MRVPDCEGTSLFDAKLLIFSDGIEWLFAIRKLCGIDIINPLKNHLKFTVCYKDTIKIRTSKIYGRYTLTLSFIGLYLNYDWLKCKNAVSLLGKY